MLSNIPGFSLITLVTVFLLCVGSSFATATPPMGKELLLASHNRNMSKLKTGNSGLPLYLESYEQDDRVHVDVYGVFNSSFNNIAEALKVPVNWCDIVALHPNVKACTYREYPGSGSLTFYIGSKSYQPPEATNQVTYHYRTIDQQTGYLDLVLNADTGPFGTADHKMRLEAVPIDGGKTFVHVSYEYRDSLALRVTEKIYFATLGRSKVGFTITGTDSSGESIYIGGPRGALERNAVRYYFAIQAFMNTVNSPVKSQFSLRINQWYDLTSRFSKQLFDLDKKDYLLFKTTERKNQLTLQQLL